MAFKILTELLQELNFSKDGGSPYNKTFYGSEKQLVWTGKNRYYNRNGIIRGYAGDWLVAAGGTRADLPVAMEKAKKSAEYKQLMKIFDDVTSSKAAANGTFIFSSKTWDEMYGAGASVIVRRILLNGRITGVSDGVNNRLKSAEPATEQTHPDLTPVDRLVLNYTRAFEQLYKVQYPKRRAELAKLMKKQ